MMKIEIMKAKKWGTKQAELPFEPSPKDCQSSSSIYSQESVNREPLTEKCQTIENKTLTESSHRQESVNGMTEKCQSKQKCSLKHIEPTTKPAAEPAALFPKGSSLPDWIPLQTWLAFVEMRRTIRSPMTGHAVDLAIRKLAVLKASGEDIEEVLNESILNNWKGLFPVRRNDERKTTGQRKNDITRDSLGRVFGSTDCVARDVRPGLPAGDPRTGGAGLPGDPKKFHCGPN
jgi:hypothetical protein